MAPDIMAFVMFGGIALIIAVFVILAIIGYLLAGAVWFWKEGEIAGSIQCILLGALMASGFVFFAVYAITGYVNQP